MLRMRVASAAVFEKQKDKHFLCEQTSLDLNMQEAEEGVAEAQIPQDWGRCRLEWEQLSK